MFDCHNARVTATELRVFAAAVANQVDDTDLHTTESPLLTGVDDGDDAILLMASEQPDHPATFNQVDQLPGRPPPHDRHGLGDRMVPADDTPVSPAWVLIAVGRGNRQAPAEAGVLDPAAPHPERMP